MSTPNSDVPGEPPAIADSAWGVDIRDRSVVAVRLGYDPTIDRVVVIDFGRVSRSKVNHLAPDDPEGWIAHAIAALDEAHDLASHPVAVALRGRAGMVKFVEIPPIDEKNLLKLAHYEVKHQVHPLDLKDVTWQHQRLHLDAGASDDSPGDGLAIFVARNDQIDGLMRPFEEAGVAVDMAQIHAVALANYAAYEYIDGQPQRGKLALIDVSAESTGMVLTDGIRLWHRTIPFGGDHFTRAIAKAMNLPFDKAERLKRSAAKAEQPRLVYAAMQDVYFEMATEIERCARFLSSLSGPGKVRRVIALGGGFKLDGLKMFLREKLGGISVEAPSQPPRLGLVSPSRLEVYNDNLGSLAAAQGLALQALGYGRHSVNLLPPKRRAYRSQPRSSALVRFARSLLSR